jgi:hypothetical protein
MKLFVSYSRRDGLVTTELLRNLERHLQGVCSPFIHCLHGNESRWQQVLVISALLRSHAVLLIESPAASTSGWVRLELIIAKILCRPLLRLKASDIGAAQLSARPQVKCNTLPSRWGLTGRSRGQ